ncbi:hypothetical protein [Flagellimonas myxillae]|uniref:hypothetical protein n=1 Tax=Flagellimonas myxillae TaxID=2942214 RepID=UPI00201FAED3|nr:hypothetical protein [Muricauda myxillae]MCL6266665.1 hypothetical protein [Muricauda myxillae]
MAIWNQKSLSIFNSRAGLKFAVRILVLAVLVVTVFENSGQFFIKKNLASFSQGFLEENVDHVDIGVFGTSHGYSSYDPRVLEYRLGVSAYNFSFAAQRLRTTLLYLDDVVDKYDLQLAVIDVYNSATDSILDEKQMNFQYETLDQTSLGFGKLQWHTTLYGMDNVFDVFPLIRNHQRWKEYIGEQKQYQIPLDKDFYKGYRPDFGLNREDWDMHTSMFSEGKTNKIRIDKKATLSEYQRERFLDIIEKLQKNDIQILFVSAPVYKNSLKKGYLDYLHATKKFLDSMGIHFIDYNALYKNLKLRKKHFKDPSHLNTNGGLVVSQHMSKYISENFSLDDSTDSEPNKTGNRYFLLNDQKDIIYKRNFKKAYMRDSVGIKNIFLYNVFKDRYELIVEGNRKKLQNSRLRFRFKIPEKDQHKSIDIDNLANSNTRQVYRNNFTNWIEFENRGFHILQFNAPYDQIDEVELTLNSNQKIFRVDSLLLTKKW